MVTIQLTIALDGKPFQFPNGLGRILNGLREWHRRGRSRRELFELDDHLLHDIGVTRGNAVEEASKPFWRL
ncbi:MAG TPA: DUF1127 domain-containing protein [Alphaproteobacteria bacterium]|nr:DUF1127 domain-containing protein [Alphaproteobacteria bacterium]